MADLPDDSDERKWIERSKKDIAYFQPLYEKYYDEIYRFIYRRTDDDDLAADLCSQTFYKALRNINQFTWMGKPFGTWLYRIAGNEIKKHYRNKKEVFIIEEDKLIDNFDLDEKNEPTEEIIIRLFDQLDDEEIRLIELKFFEEYTFKEISALLGTKESTIKMRVYRLLNKMKTLINS